MQSQNKYWTQGLLFFVSVLLAFSCAQNTEQVTSISDEDKIITVTLGENSETAITDYQASVKVYYENSRIAGGAELQNSYKLSTKIIDNSIYTRVDYEEIQNVGSSFRSVITGPNETIVFNRASGQVEYRVPITTENSEDDLSNRSLFERIDLASLRTKMVDLNYDSNETEVIGFANVVIFKSPSSLLPKSNFEDRSVNSFKILFDTEEEVFAGSELVETKEDGTIVTTTITKFYQEEDEIMVPVGEKMDIHYDFVDKIEVDTETLPIVLNEGDIEEISQEELNTLKLEVGAYEVSQTILGDPTDPDYTETYLTVYEDVSTNCLNNRYFLEVE